MEEHSREGTYTWRGHTHGWDVHTEEHRLHRMKSRDIHTPGYIIQWGHTHVGI